jgi:hypothetical protein
MRTTGVAVLGFLLGWGAGILASEIIGIIGVLGVQRAAGAPLPTHLSRSRRRHPLSHHRFTTRTRSTDASARLQAGYPPS